MQYTDKQIEEAMKSIYPQWKGEFDSQYKSRTSRAVAQISLALRMFREELKRSLAENVHNYRGSSHLPEFWKEQEEAPKETRFGGVDVSNGPLTGENQAQGWQPIITVPLISGPEQCIFIAHTSLCRYGISAFYEQGRWRDANSGAPIVWQPTHWMPIPPLPEDK